MAAAATVLVASCRGGDPAIPWNKNDIARSTSQLM
jgi:hypothetical protein